MNELSHELEKEILRKNTILNSYCKDHYTNKEKVHDLELELDELLYRYYKLLRYKMTKNDPLFPYFYPTKQKKNYIPPK